MKVRPLFQSSLIAALLIASVQKADAKTFTSQYCSFELPPGWECALEGTEWVCQSENKERQKEAIIILAAKIRGEQDSLDAYTAYLKGTKTFTLPGGKTQVSEPKYTNPKTVNGQQWIDSLHLASEVPGFYTRYLATVKEDLGVAVTFSVGKDFYAAYQGVFDKIVASLRVFRQAGGDTSKFALKNKDENLLDNGIIPEGGIKHDITQNKAKGQAGALGTTEIGLLALLAVGALMFMLKKKKKPAAKKAAPKKQA